MGHKNLRRRYTSSWNWISRISCLDSGSRRYSCTHSIYFYLLWFSLESVNSFVSRTQPSADWQLSANLVECMHFAHLFRSLTFYCQLSIALFSTGLILGSWSSCPSWWWSKNSCFHESIWPRSQFTSRPLQLIGGPSIRDSNFDRTIRPVSWSTRLVSYWSNYWQCYCNFYRHHKLIFHTNLHPLFVLYFYYKLGCSLTTNIFHRRYK